MNRRKWIGLAWILSMMGCGGGTSVGNPLVTLESVPYGSSGGSLYQAFAFSTATVTDFKFCVTKLKLTNANDEAVTQNGSASIEAILGLIDVSNPAVTTTWGDVSIPVGFSLKQLNIELHRDPERCGGADYSMRYNGSSLTKDLEFHFEFNPTVSVADGDTLKLGLSSIASALESAVQAGKFNDENIGEFLNINIKGTGSK